MFLSDTDNEQRILWLKTDLADYVSTDLEMTKKCILT